MPPSAAPIPAPCPPDRLRLVMSGADRGDVLRDLVRSTRLDAPRLSDPTPEGALLEDLLLAAAALGLHLPELDAAAPPGPGAGELLRLGARVTEDGVVEPALAAALYYGEEIGLPHRPRDPVDMAAPTGADMADAWLGSPARLVARHPELIPNLLDTPLRGSFERWCGAVFARETWPWRPDRIVPAGRSGADALPGDRVASHLQAPSELAGLLRAAESAPDHGVRLESEAISLGRWLLGRLDEARLWTGAAIGRSLAGALLESPFFGADAELLGARLSAIRRALPDAEPLGLRPEILPLIAAIQRLPSLDPTLESALRMLAARAASDAEGALRSEDVHPDWPAELPVVPTQAARYLLQRHNASWFDALNLEAVAEVIRALEGGPDDATSWIWPALFRATSLPADARASLRPTWERAARSVTGDHLARVVFGGLALASTLTPDDQILLLDRAAATPDRWRVGLLRLVAERVPGVRAEAVKKLFAELAGPVRALRPPATVALLRLVREGFLETSALERIESQLDPELRRHSDVADERRRLGRDR